MEFWLKQDKEEFRLPVNPAEYSINGIQRNTTVDIINIGEINIMGKRGLKTISLSSFFPTQKYDFCQYKDFPKPSKCVKIIKTFKESQYPIRVIITGVLNMLATIESFEYGEKDGTGDIDYTIELKEYRIPVLKQSKKKNEKKNEKKKNIGTNKKAEIEKTSSNKKVNLGKTKTNRNTKKVENTTYIVKKGDTLMGIAKKITGDASNWVAIKNQNNIKDTRKIQIGTKLIINVN